MKIKKAYSILAIFLCSLIFVSCSGQKLNHDRFVSVVEKHDMDCAEDKSGSDIGVKAWTRAQGNGNSADIELIEFNSEGNAASFINKQTAIISENGVKFSGSMDSGEQAQSGGIWYYFAISGKYVIMANATSPSDKELILKVLDKLPGVSRP